MGIANDDSNTTSAQTAADSEAQADFLLGHYLAMSGDARMIFSAKMAAHQVGKVFTLDRAKLDAFNGVSAP